MAARAVFGAAIRRARDERELTQTELEIVSGLDQTVISRLERGRPIGLRLSTLMRLLDSLQVRRIVLEVESLDAAEPHRAYLRRVFRRRAYARHIPPRDRERDSEVW